MRQRVAPGPEFVELCTSYRASAFRWECQGVYREPDEQEPLRRWRSGEVDNAFLAPWLATVRRLRAEGRRFERVRMVTDPPTEYLRWEHSFTHLNVEAGEDIRWLPEAIARRLDDMPEHDFYLFDDERVAIVEFNEHGVAGADVTDDPATVARHQRWRDLVWPAATPHGQYDPLHEINMRSP